MTCWDLTRVGPTITTSLSRRAIHARRQFIDSDSDIVNHVPQSGHEFTARDEAEIDPVPIADHGHVEAHAVTDRGDRDVRLQFSTGQVD